MAAFGVLFIGVRAFRFVELISIALPSICDRSGHRTTPPRSGWSEERTHTPRTSGQIAQPVADPEQGAPFCRADSAGSMSKAVGPAVLGSQRRSCILDMVCPLST